VGLQELLKPLLLLFGLNFIVLLVWNVTDPAKWVRDPIEEGNQNTFLQDAVLGTEATYGHCDSANYRVFAGVLIGMNMIVSLVAIIQAYECRKISTEYDESLWISGAMGMLVQAWVIGFPVLRLVGDNPRVMFMVKVAIIFVSSMTALLMLFLPKMRYLRQSFELQKKEIASLGAFPSHYVQPHERRDSDTGHSHSQYSEDTHGRYHPHGMKPPYGHLRPFSGLEPPSTNDNTNTLNRPTHPASITSGMEGIRVLQSTKMHSDEVLRLQKTLRQAESRNKVLNERLSRLQEKITQYAISGDPHQLGSNGGGYILAARARTGEDSSR